MTNGSNEKIRKKLGRPATGRDPVTALRLAPALKSAIENWAQRQLGKPSRSEAIRRLLELALAEVQDPSSGGGIRNQTKISERDVTFDRNQNASTIFLPIQCRMARAALGLSIRDLAAAAKVAVDTVVRFERGDELKERTIEALRRALEAAGVEFTNADRPGVLLTKAAAARSPEPASSSKPTRAPVAVRVKAVKRGRKKR